MCYVRAITIRFIIYRYFSHIIIIFCHERKREKKIKLTVTLYITYNNISYISCPYIVLCLFFFIKLTIPKLRSGNSYFVILYICRSCTFMYTYNIPNMETWNILCLYICIVLGTNLL